jgi:hypothetical protein
VGSLPSLCRLHWGRGYGLVRDARPPVAEGSWQRRVFEAGDSRSIPQGAQASSGDADWHHVPPLAFILP